MNHRFAVWLRAVAVVVASAITVAGCGNDGSALFGPGTQPVDPQNNGRGDGGVRDSGAGATSDDASSDDATSDDASSSDASSAGAGRRDAENADAPDLDASSGNLDVQGDEQPSAGDAGSDVSLDGVASPGESGSSEASSDEVGGGGAFPDGGPVFDPCAAMAQPGYDPAGRGLAACCIGVGPAHCVPAGEVIDRLASQLAPCTDTTAVCVPDAIIRGGGQYRPASCISSLGNFAGACLSRCLSFIANNPQAIFLQQDGCGAGDLCVPCTNPLDGTPTGACDIDALLCPTDGGATDDGSPMTPDDASPGDASTVEDAGGADVGDAVTGPRDASADVAVPDGEAGAVCPYSGPPLLDPAIFPACSPACGGAHCVPRAVVPASAQSLLAGCASVGGAPGVCAPDVLIESAGNALPPECIAFAGTSAPGRCLSTCLPAVQLQPSLEQSTCAVDSRCVPCNDPLTGAGTGACAIVSCDAPPSTPVIFPDCCSSGGSSGGRCVPRSQVPDAQEANLSQDICPDASSLCVPDELLPESSAGVGCSFLQVPGTCLSRCVNLGGVGGFFPQATCPSNHTCIPCLLAPPGSPGC